MLRSAGVQGTGCTRAVCALRAKEEVDQRRARTGSSHHEPILVGVSQKRHLHTRDGMPAEDHLRGLCQRAHT